MDAKEKALRASGTYNENFEAVRAEQFQDSSFFYPRDLVQVKYEMVRSVATGELSVTEASALYGFSRQTCYRCMRTVEREGMAGLFPKKRGPKDGYKFREAARGFVDAYLNDHPGTRSAQVAAALKDDMGVDVHPRTIERYRSKRG